MYTVSISSLLGGFRFAMPVKSSELRYSASSISYTTYTILLAFTKNKPSQASGKLMIVCCIQMLLFSCNVENEASEEEISTKTPPSPPNRLPAYHNSKEKTYQPRSLFTIRLSVWLGLHRLIPHRRRRTRQHQDLLDMLLYRMIVSTISPSFVKPFNPSKKKRGP